MIPRFSLYNSRENIGQCLPNWWKNENKKKRKKGTDLSLFWYMLLMSCHDSNHHASVYKNIFMV